MWEGSVVVKYPLFQGAPIRYSGETLVELIPVNSDDMLVKFWGNSGESNMYNYIQTTHTLHLHYYAYKCIRNSNYNYKDLTDGGKRKTRVRVQAQSRSQDDRA